MAAIFAAGAGAETILLERTRDGGRKILISGGGRCNVLPMHLDESRFVTDSSPNVLRKMLRAWPLAEQIAFFENELQLPLAEEPESSKLFPRSNKARDVRDGLLAYATRAGATVRMNSLVTGFAPVDGGWRVELDDHAPVDADAMIVDFDLYPELRAKFPMEQVVARMRPDITVDPIRDDAFKVSYLADTPRKDGRSAAPAVAIVAPTRG